MAVVEAFSFEVLSGQFTGQTLDIAVPGGLTANWCGKVTPGTNSVSADSNRANEAFCQIIGDPYGNFGVTTAADTIRLARHDASPASDLVVNVSGLRCTDTSDASGFTLRGVFELTLAAATGTVTSAHAGVVDTDQLQVIDGGSRCAATSTFRRSCGQPRLRHTATDVEANRTRTDSETTVTAFLIEWGSDVTVELVELDEASITTGGDLGTTGDWTTTAITSVDAATAFVTATYTSSGSSTPSKAPTGVVTVLGDGVTLPTGSTSTVATGVQTGGHAVKGYIYVVSDPNWYAARTLHAHGTLVGNGVTSTTTALTIPSGTETYSTTSTIAGATGTRFIQFHASCESEFTSEFRLAQFSFVPTSDSLVRYTRQIADKSDPYGDGLAVIEQLDFGGSPFGDPNDIDGSESSASVDRNHSVVANGIEYSTMTVNVRDSAGLIVPSVSVTAQVGSNPPITTTADANGVATFNLTSTTAATLGTSVKMGASNTLLWVVPLITYVETPRNWGSQLGVNLGKVQDFTSTAPFTDLILSGRGGEVIPRAGGSHQQAKEDFDSDGWQQSCGTSDSVVYYITTNAAKDLPSGTYIVTYTPGTWAGFDTSQVTFLGGTVDSHTTGRMEVTWDGATLAGPRINPTSAAMTSADYVKDFQMVHEDDEATYDRSTNLWRQDYLDWVDNFEVLRLMDYGQTNYSYVQAWSDRPTTTTQSCGRWLYDTDAPSTKRHIGVPDEWMIDLCNRTKSDAWICIPHRGTDDYVDQKLTLWRDNLDDDLVIHLEYSNEMSWNGSFGPQYNYREDLRVLYGLPDSSTGRQQAYAIRAAEIMARAMTIFGQNQQRLRRVVGSQSRNPTVTTTLLTADLTPGTGVTGTAYEYFDEVAIAPYYGNSVDEAVAATALTATRTDMEDTVMTPSTGFVAQHVTNIAAISSRLKLVAYEGGQHVTEGSYLAMNELSGMRDLTKDGLDDWDVVSNDALMCYFKDMFEPSGSGAWGLLEGLADVSLAPAGSNYKWYGWQDWKISKQVAESDLEWRVGDTWTSTAPLRRSQALRFRVPNITADRTVTGLTVPAGAKSMTWFVGRYGGAGTVTAGTATIVTGSGTIEMPGSVSSANLAEAAPTAGHLTIVPVDFDIVISGVVAGGENFDLHVEVLYD